MSSGERPFDAVLFDWCGTLVEYPTVAQRFEWALGRLIRPASDATVEQLASAYTAAKQHPDVVEANRRCDLSREDHRQAKMLACELAGIDRTVAAAFEATYADLDTYTAYPEVVEVFRTLADSGVKMAIVSDFHVDLRPLLASVGVADLIAGVALSCEVGVTKPDPKMFQVALDAVAVPPARCLMVGDNPGPDSGGAALGITTLVLPFQRHGRGALLRRVVSLVQG